MLLTTIDLVIIGLYLASTIAIGLILKKQASKNLDSYFLGGKTLPWYMLSLSNASGMFDISGTILLVTWLFVYGLKSIWIPWAWPVFNQVFLMVFLSLWLRRSNVLTGAEWIRTRFGDDAGGKLSHGAIVAFALIGVIGFLVYGFVGIGKFMEIFIPWEAVAPYVPFDVAAHRVPQLYGIVFTAIATFYVMLGGMLSIVWADLLQFTIMTVSAIVIAVIAMTHVSPEVLHAALPEGWANPFFGWTLDLDWNSKIPQVVEKVKSDGFGLFGAIIMMYFFKGLLISAAGPAPNYDMQKILATKSPKEAAKMSGFVSVVLMPIRYLMVASFAVLALVFYKELDLTTAGSVTLDFENILPAAIKQFVPVGFLGLILAGLLAAFMSTFASTVNAAPAYLVNDIYKRYINPNAPAKRLVNMSYIVSIAVVALSTTIGFYILDVNSIMQWIVSALWGGYTVANILKWYWWRFNGMGYFAGMVAGILSAFIMPSVISGVFPDVSPAIAPLYAFPWIALLSGIASVLVSLMTEPEDMERLKSFYKNVRPWGFWGPIHDAVAMEDSSFIKNPNFGRDMMNVSIGIVLQTSLVALPIFLVIKEFYSVAITVVIAIVACMVLWKTWYKNLSDLPSEEMEKERLAKA